MRDPRERDWFSLEYLADGDARQQDARLVLKSSGIFDILKDYSPVLCGTIPLGCYLQSSDLDVICQAGNLEEFTDFCVEKFSYVEDFYFNVKSIRGDRCAIVRFSLDDWQIELFAKDQPVELQYAFGHMLAEAWLLYKSEDVEEEISEIRKFKLDGLSTEEAFAEINRIYTDPYVYLYELYLKVYQPQTKNSQMP